MKIGGDYMRLIDADAKEPYVLDGRYAVNTLVWCKDCKNWMEWENGAGSCQRSGSVMWLGTDATDFCSFAERKDND